MSEETKKKLGTIVKYAIDILKVILLWFTASN